jgi:hypothetical protein
MLERLGFKVKKVKCPYRQRQAGLRHRALCVPHLCPHILQAGPYTACCSQLNLSVFRGIELDTKFSDSQGEIVSR